MKIVNKQEFLKLPPYTLYSVYEPHAFYGLYVKGETLEKDYTEMDLIGNVEADNTSEFVDRLESKSFPLDFDDWGRNGLYEDNTMYAVYESEEVGDLIEFLKKCRDI